MKSVYIKPETVNILCTTLSFIASSTEWHMKPDGSEKDNESNIEDGEGHDPNADAKGYSGLWDDNEEEENW